MLDLSSWCHDVQLMAATWRGQTLELELLAQLLQQASQWQLVAALRLRSLRFLRLHDAERLPVGWAC